MTTPGLPARPANPEQFDAWNGDTGRLWADEADQRDQLLAPVADELFGHAALTSGEAVLDLGCGCGATTLGAARAVGATGSALGVDLSAPMLDVARQRARERGLDNVRFEQADAQTAAFPDGAYDVVVSRFGTMFFADELAAFRNVGRAMRPGGRLCIVTWQPLPANPWLTVAGSVLLRYGTAPEVPAGPGMFAQADPEALAAMLTAAGFGAVVSEPVSLSLRLGADPQEAVEFLAAGGPAAAILETIDAAARAAALDELTSALAEHAGADGVRLGGAIWVTTADRTG
jgi:SAM-dependent methyltransferase